MMAGQQEVSEPEAETGDRSGTAPLDSDYLLRSAEITSGTQGCTVVSVIPAVTPTLTDPFSQPKTQAAPIEPGNAGAKMPSGVPWMDGTPLTGQSTKASEQAREPVPDHTGAASQTPESRPEPVSATPGFMRADVADMRLPLEVEDAPQMESVNQAKPYAAPVRMPWLEGRVSEDAAVQSQPVVAPEPEAMGPSDPPAARVPVERVIGLVEDGTEVLPIDDTSRAPEAREHPTQTHGLVTRFGDGIDLPGARAAEAVVGSQAHLPPADVLAAKMIHQIVKSARVHMLDGGAEMTLRLDPPHLGMLHMTVSAQEGTVTASLQTSTETARQVLEADLSGLRQALSDAGIQVDNVEVSVGGNLDQGWSARDGAQDGSADQQRSTGSATVAHAFQPEIAAAAAYNQRPSTGQLDYLA